MAALSAVLVFLIARRAAGWQAGLVAALLFSLDPFVIKLNSLNMLETSAMAWVLAGYWTLISGLTVVDESEENTALWHHFLPTMFEGGQPIALWRQLLIGMFFGLALLTKETMIFVTLLPLAVFYVLQWSLTRRALTVIGGLALGIYALYPAAVLMTGQWQVFVQEKTQGFVRFTGLVRSTGFKRPGGPSLTSTAVDRLANYGATYLLFALALIAVFILLKRGGTINRVVAVWTLSTYAMLSYNILFGTLEEQFFYYLVVVCILATAIAAVQFIKSPAGQRARGAAFHASLVLFILMTSFNVYQWTAVHLEPNDGFVNVLDFLHEHVRHGQHVASTSETGQYVLEGYLSGPWGTWTTVDQLKAFAPDYVLVTPHTLVWNNRMAAEALLDWIDENGQQIYVFNGRENNTLRLYRLPWAKAPMTNTAPSALPGVGTPAGSPTADPTAALTGEPSIATAPPASPTVLAPVATPTSLPPMTTAAQPTGTATTLPPPTRPAVHATPVPPKATTLSAQWAQAAAEERTPADVVQAVAAAEAKLQTGRLEATMYYGAEANSSLQMDFDFGGVGGGPRYHLLYTYPGTGSPQTLERIAAGDQAWQRQSTGPGENVGETEGPWVQVQPYLPHAANATEAAFVNGDHSIVQWYDPERDADVIVQVDPDTGVPQQMGRVVRSNRAALQVRYRQWNVPVHITAPGQQPPRRHRDVQGLLAFGT